MMSRERTAGFTLIEVVVALALMVGSVSIVMQIFAGGLKNLHRIELAHRAMGHGENVMNQILADGELSGPTSLQGELDDDFRFSAEITEWQEPTDGLEIDIASANVLLLKITVYIHFINDRRGKMYRLNSLRAISLQTAQQGLAESGNPLQRSTGRGRP